jgi:hypothetical protein
MARLITWTVAIVVVLGGVMAATGVLRFESDQDRSTITIDKKELKEKTHNAVKEAEKTESKILEKTGDALHSAAKGMRESSDGKAPAKPPANSSTSGKTSDGGKSTSENGNRRTDQQPAK